VRAILGLAGVFVTLAALPAADPPSARLSHTPVTWEKAGAFLGEAPAQFPKAAGVEVTAAPGLLKTPFKAQFKNEPFWAALQAAADATKSRIALSGGGRKAELVPLGNSRERAATSGAFRVVAQQVVGRALLAEGLTTHEVQLLVHWEPRLRVYRIDTTPKISAATDVPGSKIAADAGGAQVLPTDSTSEMRVRLTGLARDSEKLTTLAGTFKVTAAERLMEFAFAGDAKLPVTEKQAGVSATLKRVQKQGDTWEIAVEVLYPEGQPAFESFQGEWWLRDNRLTLVSPAGKPFAIDNYEVPSPDVARPLVVVHRFEEDAAKGLTAPTAKGWKVVYTAPSPLAEATIPFELKDVPLP
jgi:hypothetical protein